MPIASTLKGINYDVMISDVSGTVVVVGPECCHAGAPAGGEEASLKDATRHVNSKRGCAPGEQKRCKQTHQVRGEGISKLIVKVQQRWGKKRKRSLYIHRYSIRAVAATCWTVKVASASRARISSADCWGGATTTTARPSPAC
ncbi:hypothetical protein IF1G_00549 [Cordyceps javanica]|uniref:Uncharacterized protein n=1 Tax=Cordyceps javanica TaxID=43265 RepID=A0A545VFW2_9HYPO|nr:hypothetical protein IF1G_00549 [Cordyceps javanica]